MITQCLDAVDKMHLSMRAYVDKTPLSFDLNVLLEELKINKDEKSVALPDKKNNPDNEEEKVSVSSSTPPENNTQKNVAHTLPHETIQVSLSSLEQVSALMEKMQIIKISMNDYRLAFNKLNGKSSQVRQSWQQFKIALEAQQGKVMGESLLQLSNINGRFLSEMMSEIETLNRNVNSQLNDLSVVSNALQDEVRTLRLIPAATLFRTFPRYMRDLALKLDKKINFSIEGDSVKMDKMVLEGLQDPITHLLRNALDHGIEDASVRKQRGKSEIGTITIEIQEKGQNIVIKLEDDGGGIDLQAIGASAVNKKVITQSELDAMSDVEILQCIFLPGFSTKEKVTQVSGRGVGLDVVKTNIEELKGSVEVSTELNVKTTFTLTVPLSLASERGFLINCAGQLFVIPTYAVERILMTSSNNIVEVEAVQAILIDEKAVPLLMLSDILQLKKLETQLEQLSVLVLKKSGLTVALIVDEIIGERELVVKSLQRPLVSVSCVIGGTLSGNGDVILVLNPDDIITHAFNTTSVSRITLQKNKEKQKVKPHILVVDDSITTRNLEKNVLENQDYQVTTAVDGQEAWEMLQKQSFSLLITDVMMPNMDGFELTDHVKKSEKLRNLPVIIVTSRDSEEEKLRGLEVGADFYLIKNEFESGILLQIVEQLL
jgi:chemotaxis protein histidine kinase CheA